MAHADTQLVLEQRCAQQSNDLQQTLTLSPLFFYFLSSHRRETFLHSGKLIFFFKLHVSKFSASQDHYCQCEIEEMTVLRDVDFFLQAVTCLVFVTLNEFRGRVECVCLEKIETMSATTELISRLTSLISLFATYLFSCSMNQETCFI